MTRRERLLHTLRGESVDRPAVSFYEIGLFAYDADDPNPYNVHNDPSWRALIDVAETRTDLMRGVGAMAALPAVAGHGDVVSAVTWDEGDSRFTRRTIDAGGRTLTEVTRRDTGTDTVWKLEHFLKDVDDLRAYLEIPDELLACDLDCSNLLEVEAELGEAGVVMIDTGDPLCGAADMFSMEQYMILAVTEPVLFHRLVEKFAIHIQAYTERLAREYPGRLWRIFGPEYASEPYLPPSLFGQYVVRYTGPMVRAIKRHGGFARIHSHGRLRNILPAIAAMGADGLDPIEPPPQGDMELCEVRRQVGKQMVLFGNLEASDLENLRPDQFEPKIVRALREGTAGEGRGFVLMPSASPCGRSIRPTVLRNYELMVELAENWGG